MQRDVKQFSINEVNEVATENSKEFAIARIAVLSTRPNSHRIKITDEILRRDGLSILGKFIVCSFNGIDATTHKSDEVIVGIVPKDAKYEFVESEDGHTTLFVEGIISKLYAKQVYEMFKVDNFRNMSVEMFTANDFELPNGDTEIEGLEITGITILGKSVNGSCPDANMSIVAFSEEKAESYYKEFSNNKENALELAKKLVNILNTEKEFSSSQDEENLLDTTNKNEQEAYMEEKDIKALESTEEKEDVVMSTEEAEDEKEMAKADAQEENQDEAEDEKEMAKEEEPQETEDEKEMDCGCEDKEEMSCGENLSCDCEASDEKVDEEEKEFSFKDYVDTTVFNDKEENIKEFVNKLIEMNATEILEEAVRLFSENAELSLEKAKIEEEKRSKKFASIMASVKEDLDEKSFAELSEEGENISLENLGAFENKVKAFAYECSKNNNKPDTQEPEIMVFGGNENIEEVKKLDVFERISRA